MDKEREGKPWLFFLKCLLAAYILTGALLILLSLLVYKLRLSEQIVSAAVIGIYIAVNLAAGWLTGKKMQSRKFLWGLLMGSAYFLILTVAFSQLENKRCALLMTALRRKKWKRLLPSR